MDVSSGETGIDTNIDAAVEAISQAQNLEIILVGQENKIDRYFAQKHFRPQEISIVNADDIVGMDEKPLQAAKNKNNSIVKGIDLVRRGDSDAFVSTGNTGAIAASSMLRLKKIANIDRTPILTVFPTMAGHPIAMLDVGANVDCKPHHLLQFAVMGATYAQLIMEIDNPRVGLLSIGEEPSKGNAVTKNTNKLLSKFAHKLDLNFVGNIEGRDILTGFVDVIVCDGFIGNVLLKYTESIFSLVKTLFKKGRRISVLSILGGLLLYPSLKRTMKDFNYAEYGGAPLLGVDGNVVIGHGTSSVKAVTNAILLAQTMVLANLQEALRKATEKLKELDDENSNIRDRFVYTEKGAN